RPITGAEAAALGRVGITSFQKLITTGPVHPTMNPYPTSDPLADRIDLTATANGPPGGSGPTLRFINKTNAIAANPAFLQAAFTADPTAEFLVVGVGPRNTMVSKVMQDAPQSVPQDNSFTPATRYSRVGLIFKVSGTEVAQTERARFIAAVALEDD